MNRIDNNTRADKSGENCACLADVSNITTQYTLCCELENELLKVANDEDSIERYLHCEEDVKINSKIFFYITEPELLQEEIKFMT